MLLLRFEVHKEKGETFFVSLAMGLDSTTLYVSLSEKSEKTDK